MNTIKRIVKNSLVFTISQIIYAFFGFFFNIYTAKYLGSEGFGILSFSLAFTGIFSLIEDLGLSTLLTREISRDKSLASKYLGNFSVIKTILSIITLGLIVITIKYLGYPEKTMKVVYIMAISTTFTSFTLLFNSLFQAFEQLEYNSIGKIISSSLMLIGALIAIKMNLDIISFVYIYLIVNGIVLTYSILVCIRKFEKLKIEIDLKLWRIVIRESLPFWLTSLFVIIYFRIDMVMLSVMTNDTTVGWYAASYRFIEALNFIPTALMLSIYPVFSKLYISSEDSLKLAFRKSLKFLIFIGIPIGIGIALLSDKIILLVYGKGYAASALSLKILVWASVLSYINWAPSTLLNSTNKQKSLMIITCIGAIFNILLNYVLIPSMSYIGASIATVATEFLVGILITYVIYKSLNETPLFAFTQIKKSLLSGMLMAIFLLLFKKYTIFLLIPTGAIIYFLSLFISKGIDEEDLNLVRKALNR